MVEDESDLIAKRKRQLAAKRKRKAVVFALAVLLVISLVSLTMVIVIMGRKKGSRDSGSRESEAVNGTITVNGIILRFYVGDDGEVALKEIAEGLRNKGKSRGKSKLRPALELRTDKFGDVSCLFTDGQEDKLFDLTPGDRLAVRGRPEVINNQLVIIRECSVVASGH